MHFVYVKQFLGKRSDSIKKLSGRTVWKANKINTAICWKSEVWKDLGLSWGSVLYLTLKNRCFAPILVLVRDCTFMSTGSCVFHTNSTMESTSVVADEHRRRKKWRLLRYLHSLRRHSACQGGCIENLLWEIGSNRSDVTISANLFVHTRVSFL